jgi:hypothetical protein
VALTRHVVAFGNVRWRIVGDDDDFMAIAGGRVALRTRAIPARTGQPSPSASAIGREVRVTATSGTRRKGRLVALTASEVVLREGEHDLSIPLRDVQRIEKISHRARNWGWSAAGLGFLAGALGDCAGSSPGDCVPLAGGVFAGIAGGAAAVMGSLADAASAERNLLNLAPGPSSSTSVVPMLTARRVGAALAYRW